MFYQTSGGARILFGHSTPTTSCTTMREGPAVFKHIGALTMSRQAYTSLITRRSHDRIRQHTSSPPSNTEGP